MELWLQQLARARHDLAFAGECQHLLGFGEGNPARLVHFPIMVPNISALILEQEEVDVLVEADAISLPIGADVPVLDDLDRRDELRVDAGFFTDFANSRELG